MNGRKDIQRQQELDVMTLFVQWLGQQEQVTYTLVERPDPPDGIYTTPSRTIWLEVVGIYRSGDEAHEDWSLVTPSEKRFQHPEHPIMSPDERTADALVTVLVKKISSKSYRSAFEKYGRGILICCERDPLLGKSTLEEIHSRLQDEVKNFDEVDKGFFKDAYLYDRVRGFLKLLYFTPD